MANMMAYYYSFDSTGTGPIDAVLEAVAAAGKAYHHTESWNDTGYDGGPSHTTKIQEAAQRGAERFKIMETALKAAYILIKAVLWRKRHSPSGKWRASWGAA